RKSYFSALEQTGSPHHVLQRNWIRVEEDRLIQFKQIEMQLAGRGKISLGHFFAQERDAGGHEVPYCIHQSGRSNRKHRETQRLKAAKNPELNSKPQEQLADKIKVCSRMLHPDQIWKPLCNLQHSLRANRHPGPARDMIDQQRERGALANRDEVCNQSSLRRPNVVRGDNQQRVRTGSLGSGSQLCCFLV